MGDFSGLVRQFLYYPDRLPVDLPPPPWAKGSREVWMATEDRIRIHGLWWPEPQGAPVILYLHGNAQEAYSWSLVYEDLAPLGYRMLLIDYRGYGKSEGLPFEQGLYLDGQAALSWLKEEGVKEKEIVIFGKSLGGGVACEIAQGLELRALILESTFTSLKKVAARLFPLFPPGISLGEDYQSLDKIPKVTCPVLIIHGDRDELIPYEEGKALYEAAPLPKAFYPVNGAGHNDVSTVAGSRYLERIREFLRKMNGNS